MAQDGRDDGSKRQKVVYMDVRKRETHHSGAGYKQLARRLKSSYKVAANKDELTSERLAEASLIIFGAPRDKFSNEEFEVIKAYLKSGGSVAFFLGEGGEAKLGTNVNYLLEEFGMTVHSDAVVRTTYYKYMHPKEVFIQGGVLNAELVKQKQAASLKGSKSKKTAQMAPSSGSDMPGGGLKFVYPYGASMTVQAPAHPLLSTGPISYPLNRPIAGAWEHPEGSKKHRGLSAGSRSNGNDRPEDGDGAPSDGRSKGPGRLLVMASVDVFGDQWLDKEENSKLCDVLMRWLLGDGGVQLDRQREYDLSDYTRVPNSEALADCLRCCLQETEELPRSFTKMVDEDLFKFDTNIIPEAVSMFSRLSVKHEFLTLIPPNFECPLPVLNPAVFPPRLREAPPPALDQFDLDEHFASDGIRLAQLTNKCTAEDLRYYIAQCGEILGVTASLPEDVSRSAAHVLDAVFRQVVQCKMLSAGTVGMKAPAAAQPSALMAGAGVGAVGEAPERDAGEFQRGQTGDFKRGESGDFKRGESGDFKRGE
ncbi:unnamed protein product, partial [Chrysoparadoxa australica]